MRLTVLGSGTLVPDPERGSSSHHLEIEGARVLLDCGAGALWAMARASLPWEATSHILLTHFHTDHVGGLAPLLFALNHGVAAAREDPLTILGPPGIGRFLEALTAAYGPFVTDPGFPLVVRELSPGESWREPSASWQVKTVPARHSPGAMGVRLESGEGVLGYTGDTGPARDLGPFFRGSQVLIAECSQPDGGGMDLHLSPGDLADLARHAMPDLLVTVHVYPPLDPESVPGMVARHGYEGRVLAGRDGLQLDWVAGKVVPP